jgi:signal transduction histidine kinase
MIDKSIVDIQYQFTPPLNRNKEAIENSIRGIVTMETPEIFNQLIDGEIVSQDRKQLRNIQTRVFPIKLNGYNLFCTVIRDTTEIKRYEREILRISEDKDKFYSVIAQYLYSPFSLFHNFSKTMAEELDSLSIREIQKMVATMSKSATNLYSLLDNMLQYTRVNQGKIIFKPEKVNLSQISLDAVSILKPVYETKNIRINHLIPADVNIYADVFMMKTVFRNLVTNAIKFSRHEGQINISVHQGPSEVTVSVLDNSSGTDSAYISKLFDINHLNPALGETEEKGSTLGLLLCREFIEKHGGRIWAESDKNNGCTVKFTLPFSSE